MVLDRLLFGGPPCHPGRSDWPDESPNETADTQFRMGRLYQLGRCTPVEDFLEACCAVITEWMKAHPEELRDRREKEARP